jgi:hypothetical protein
VVLGVHHRKDARTWELRLFSEQAYAIFEAFEADESEEDRRDARKGKWRIVCGNTWSRAKLQARPMVTGIFIIWPSRRIVITMLL